MTTEVTSPGPDTTTPDIIPASPPVATDTSPPSPSPPSTETATVATSLYQCECGQRYSLTEDKRTQLINQGETNEALIPFNSCGCARHADGMFLVEDTLAVASEEKEPTS